eukprot:TRINITY_DN116_c1_g1_i1.p2 TRINITY_DN116_c1_g1~~TRINITY_DN116_c1_g1_i1.p2  ORF type:complete len:100 (-),score=9.95 TRINITY_DN116_c1_g1_i1:382-681(-)
MRVERVGLEVWVVSGGFDTDTAVKTLPVTKSPLDFSMPSTILSSPGRLLAYGENASGGIILPCPSRSMAASHIRLLCSRHAKSTGISSNSSTSSSGAPG